VLRKKCKELLRQKDEMQAQQYAQKEEKPVKAINELRPISSDKRKQIEEEYLNGNKYLKKMTAEDEEEIYKAWKDSKKKL